MLVQCLNKRDGISPVIMGNVKYLFMPHRPNGKKGAVTSICEIDTKEHLDFLLKRDQDGIAHSTQFREFIEGQVDPEEAEEVNLMGFAMPPHKEGRTEGYRIEDRRDPKHILYAGMDGQWRDSLTGLTPFDTQMEAWQWLKEEAANGGLEQPEQPEEPDFKKLAKDGLKEANSNKKKEPAAQTT